MTAVEWLDQEEGFEPKPYQDTLGVWTFGGGLTYITEEENEIIVRGRVCDINEKLRDKFSWFARLSSNRQIMIISMVYQLGFTGFCNFKKMIKAIEDEEYELAALEMKDSRAYVQTMNRWDRQIAIFIKG